jgi:hypothetical protein
LYGDEYAKRDKSGGRAYNFGPKSAVNDRLGNTYGVRSPQRRKRHTGVRYQRLGEPP